MAVQFQEDAGQYLLRIGDTVLLYAKEARGYAYSELTSSRHNSVALYKVDSVKDPNFPNIHFATFTVVHANKYKAQERLNDYKKSLRGREPSADEKGKLQQYQKELDFELRENELEQDRLRGSNIVYGEKVQLQHNLTKKYLSVNTTKISRTENTNLRVELTEENAHGCIFKILPRYKVRSVGDEVRYNDQVKFESIKTEGQFLHCSSREYRQRFTVLEKNRELNLSATESAFTLIPQYRPFPEHPSNAFRGGQVVRLFHRENECYVSAEGSYAEDPSVVEDVHCRKRHSDHGRLKPASTSSNVYWQFEKESDHRSGEPLSWGERCRIKHMPTRMYLTIVPKSEGGYAVSLKDRQPGGSFGGSQDDLDTMFSLSPVIREGDTILMESYARIKHLQTGTWLHLEKGQHYERRAFNPDAAGLEGLEWDSAELFMLTATETMNYDDAFTLEKVSEQLVDRFNNVAGIVPILTAHIKKFDVTPRPVLDSRTAYLVMSALDDLASYLMTPSERENKDRQKLLRNLRVLELVIKILGFFSTDAPDADDQRTVCKACYKVIKSYLNGDSRKNENYLARFIEFFKKQVNMGLNAEEVMIEMVEDNSAIVTRVAETEMDYMIDQLVTQKDPRFMEFLGNLCVCAGRPIPATQRAILNNLIEEHGKDVFYRLEVGVSSERPDAQSGGIYVQTPGTREWRDLTQIARKLTDVSDECEFLESQLSLFARLCKGNNAHSIRSLGEDELGWVTFDLVLGCASHSQLQPSLRSKFVELMIVMFVDVGENRNVLENLSLSFVYEHVVEDPYKDTGTADTIAFTGVENVNFPAMRDWILEYIKECARRGVVAEETIENVLLADVLQVLQQLVTYGYYDDAEDVDDVLGPLTGVLNGFTDIPFSTDNKPKSDVVKNAEQAFAKGGRYVETEDNKPIFDIKKRGMEVVDLFLNFRFYIRLQRFIYDFRVLKGNVSVEEPENQHNRLSRMASGNSLLARVPATDLSRPPLVDLEALLRLKPQQVMSPENANLIQTARDRLKYLFSLSEYYIEKNEFVSEVGRTFPALLLDLANYHDDRLVQESLHLLNRFFSVEITLFQKAIQTQILVTPDSKKVFDEIKLELPTLRRNMSIDAGNDERVAIIRTLEKFTHMCTLSGDELQAHSQNQKILFNYGIMSDIINYVLHTSKTVSMTMSERSNQSSVNRKKTMRGAIETSGAADIPAVFVECFKFLKALARNNLDVQRRVYERMGDLLEISIAVPAIGELLTEVFTGGIEICLKVTEEQVERLFSLIATEGDEGRAELILTLQAMAKVESLDLPVKRNQAFIIKFFSKTREKFCDHILGEGEEKVKIRSELLTDADDNDNDLALLLAMTDLLASCAEGENLFIESVCQTVFSVEEILTILNSTHLQSERKRPFARFLVSVYMNTSGDKYSSGAAKLAQTDNMWEYLDNIGDLLDNVGQALKAIPPSEVHLVRQGLSSTSRRYSAGRDPRKKSHGPRTHSRSLAFVTGEDGRLLPDVLLYLTEGILPLLQSFYAYFFNPPSPSQARERQLGVSGKILTALLQLCEPLTSHLSSDAQMKLYRGTVLTMIDKGQGDIPLNLEEHVYSTFEVRTKPCRAFETTAMSRYKDLYAVELELNKAFNGFVTNYQLSYQGCNNARTQLGSKYTNEYSEFLDDDWSVPGDEYLPLGPSFQQHVGYFVSPSGQVSPSVDRLLAQLEISFNRLESLSEAERQRQDELDIKCLQIMRAIIHNEIVQIDPDLQEESPPDYGKRCTTRVQPLQNAIQDFDNAVARVVPMLSHPNDSIVKEVLAFLKAIFFSGNRHVQEGMKHVLETREERLFTTMQSLLQNAAITFNERRDLLAQMDNRVVLEQFLQNSLSSLLAPPSDPARRDVSPPPSHKDKMASFQSQGAAITIDMELGEEVSPPPTDSIAFAGIHQQPNLEESITRSDARLIQGTPSSKPRLSKDIPPDGTPKRARSSSKPLTEVFELKALGTMKGGTIPPTQATGLDSEAKDLLTFKDTHHVKLALQVLGLMCDGQYRLMQNYFREQRDNIVTINVVGEVALFLQHFYADINAETMDLVHLILQTLIEVCVGNYPNQVVIYNRQIIEALNHILAIDIADRDNRKYDFKDGINLKGSAIELLEAMLEETNTKTKDLVKEIAGALDVGALHDTLCDFRTLMQDREVQNACFDDDAEAGMFRTYHVLVHLTHYGVPAADLAPKDNDETELAQAWAYCKRRSKTVEVFYRNMDGDKILTRVNFPFDPAYELREEVVEKVKWNVNRDSPEDKLRDFLEWMKAVKRDTIHSTRLHRFLPTRLLIAFPDHRNRLLFLWSVLMNIFILMAFTLPTSTLPAYDADSEADSGTNANYSFANSVGAIRPAILDYLLFPTVNVFEILLFLFGACHLILTLWMVVEYFVINWPNFRLPRIFYRLISHWRDPPEETYSDVPVFGLRTLYVVFFMLCSILSLAFWGYFYCFCLLHVVINNDILQRVLKSITKNGLALIWVAILGVIVLFIYAVVSFAFLSESFGADNNNDGDLFCNTLYECFVSTIRYGLIDNLGLIVPLVPGKFEVSALRLFYDVSFFIIVTTIGLNIVFGIIVDTFSELRDERFRTEQDKKAVCFICGLPSHEFERRAQGFDHHVKCDHNMWTYIYYSIYLDTIDDSDHNAIQSFVHKMIHDGQLEFFPLLEALALETEEDVTSHKLEELREMVESVLERFKKEDHDKSRRSKIQDQKKWEEEHLRKDPSFDTRSSIDARTSIDLGGRPGLLMGRVPPQLRPQFSADLDPPHSPPLDDSGH